MALRHCEFAALLCLTGVVAHAQVSGGVFRGEVRDATEAMIPKAQIRIRANDTGVETIAIANERGFYVTPDLSPGIYRLTSSSAGFRTAVFGPVELQVSQTVRVDFSLAVGDVAEIVRVDATATQLLGSESAEISQVIGRRQISELPLNGRRWQQLISLSAGVNPGSPGETGSPNPINVNGQRGKANLYLVDGISTTSSAQGRGNDFNLSIDAVQEFSVQAGAYSAEYGNVAGGVINVHSKSGTNEWHGSFFEFFRNDKLDAANYFSKATGQAKNPLRYNQAGGSLGLPVRRDRTFLFGDYQGTFTRNGSPVVATVRPDSQRRGDFSELRDGRGAVIPIYDPFGTAAARTPFPGNRIPESRLDPAAVGIVRLLPQANQYSSSGVPLPFNNYAVTRTAVTDAHAFDVRFDQQFSSRSSAFVRHSFQETDAAVPSVFGLPLGGTLSGAGTTHVRNQNSGIGHIYQIHPTLIQEIRIGVNRQTTSLRQEDYGRNLSEQFGIPGVNHGKETSGLSLINVAGIFTVGGSILTPLQIAVTSWNASGKLTWIAGRHTLRVGVDGQHEMGSSGYRVFGRGFYTFLNLTTGTSVGPPGGDAFASFLTGAPLQILRDEFAPGLAGLISTRVGVYAQDDFKLTSRLTLNLGVRYDVMPYAREMYDRLSNFDPATRTLLLAGRDTNRRLRDTDFRNVAPRVGLAFSPGGLTAIRAGYGIGYVDPVGSAGVLNSTQFNIPFYFRDNITQFPFAAPRYTLSSLLPALAIPSPAAPTGDQRYLVPGDRNQYSQTWSLSVQRAWSASLLMEVAYVGTSGSRLLETSNINAAAPGPTDPVARRPFGPALGEIRAISNSAHSTYHGLQARLEHRYSRALYFLGSYTWSKSIDNQSTGTDDAAAGGQSPQDPRNHAMDRAVSSFDRSHRLAGSVVWEVPLAVRHRVWGGWQLSGILIGQTGPPFSVTMPCAAINAEGNNCRPDLIGTAVLPPEERSPGRWFNPAAFAVPSPRAYGNAGRNLLRGPGAVNVDLAVSKAFRLGGADQRRLRFRGEFFNALNKANFGLPVHTTDSPALGTITSASSGRVVQLSARMEF